MKMQLLLATAVVLAIQTAGAQNPPPAGQPPAGQPPQGQMPPAGQPPKGQPPVGQPPQGQTPPKGQMPPSGQMPPPGQMPPQGQPPQGQMPPPGQMPPQGAPKGPALSPEQCAKEIPKIKKAGENCLNVKKEDKRRECFDKVGKKYPQNFWESCRGVLEPLKNELEAKAKEKYPNQASGLDGGGDKGPGPNGAQPGQPGQPGQPPQGEGKPAPKVACDKIVPKAKKSGEACLKIKDQGKRKTCFDKIGEELEKSGAMQACDALNGLKSEMQQKEAEKYPGQPASIQ